MDCTHIVLNKNSLVQESCRQLTGFSISGRNLQFAQDTLLTATSSKQLQELQESMKDSS